MLLNWFGDYHDASSGWIYHTPLGWLYTKQDTVGNLVMKISDGFGLVLLTSKSIHLRNLIYIHQAKEIGYFSVMLTKKRISTIIL